MRPSYCLFPEIHLAIFVSTEYQDSNHIIRGNLHSEGLAFLLSRSDSISTQFLLPSQSLCINSASSSLQQARLACLLYHFTYAPALLIVTAMHFSNSPRITPPTLPKDHMSIALLTMDLDHNSVACFEQPLPSSSYDISYPVPGITMMPVRTNSYPKHAEMR